jgi:hypothetical protein
MKHPISTQKTNSGKPYDIRERMMLFACDVVRIAQELQQRGRIASELSIRERRRKCGIQPRGGGRRIEPEGLSRKGPNLPARIERESSSTANSATEGYLKEKDDPVMTESGEDLGFGIYLVLPVNDGDVTRDGVTSNAKRNAGILLPG